MAMDKISIDKTKRIASIKGIKPARVKGTNNGVQFTKGNHPRMEIITWEEFEQILNERGLAVYNAPGGWMKIMKEDRY